MSENRRTTQEDHDRRETLIGIGLMTLGVLFLTSNDAATKLVIEDLPLGQLLALRTLFAFLPVVAYVLLTGRRGELRVASWPAQGLRATTFVVTVALVALSLAALPLATAQAIFFASPFFIAALSVPLLGEQVGWRRWSAITVGFAGMLLIVQPAGVSIGWAALLPVGVAISGSLRDIVTRRISRTESSLSILVYSNVAMLIVSLTSVPFGWKPVSWENLGLLMLAGTVNATAHFLMIESLRRAPAAIVAPFRYMGLLWGIFLGYAIWSDVPDNVTVTGMLLIVGSGLYMIHREARRKRSPVPESFPARED